VVAGGPPALVLMANRHRPAGCEWGGPSRSAPSTEAQSSIPVKGEVPIPRATRLDPRTDGLVPDQGPQGRAGPGLAARLAQARGSCSASRKYEKGPRNLFLRNPDQGPRNPPTAIQERRTYYRAECLRLQGNLTPRADLYAWAPHKLFSQPRPTVKQCLAAHVQHRPTAWLRRHGSRRCARSRRSRPAKRWVGPLARATSAFEAVPARFLDREGRAIENLEQVRLPDKSTARWPEPGAGFFLCGVVKMYKRTPTSRRRPVTSTSIEYSRQPGEPAGGPRRSSFGHPVQAPSTGALGPYGTAPPLRPGRARWCRWRWRAPPRQPVEQQGDACPSWRAEGPSSTCSRPRRIQDGGSSTAAPATPPSAYFYYQLGAPPGLPPVT